MPICTECRYEWPAEKIQHGVCDQCFKFGAEKSIEISKSSRSKPIEQKGWQPPNRDSLANKIILTTSIDVPNRDVDHIISIVATEAAIGINVLRDIANNWRDFFGGRAQSSENALQSTRESCLTELKRQALDQGADAVIAVSLLYNELSTSSSGGILFVAANGTAVKLKEKIPQ